jgi:riboflavin biosynthesis pyrimidine reductase
VTERFSQYCRAREQAAIHATLPPYKTVEYDPRFGPPSLCPIGNDWSRARFDGNFYRSARPFDDDLPLVNLVFVESRDGNTGADDPSSLGGGETDKHLIYEGLSRVDADAVLSGATTAHAEDLLFSVWHPELVSLRLEHGWSRHPAQVIVTSRSAPPLERGLMFQEPTLSVFLVTTSDAAASLRLQVATRPWIHVIDGGQPLSMTRALRELKARGVRTVSAVGGRRTATALLDEQVVQDLYLTTSPKEGGEPDTPMYRGQLDLATVVVKEGTGPEEGVRFAHYRVKD